MIVFYFGSDGPWSGTDVRNIRRRNMAVLHGLSQQENVDIVYNVIRSTRSRILSKKNQTKSDTSKVKDIYIGPILPEIGSLSSIALRLNRKLLRFINKDIFKDSKDTITWCYWPKGYLDYKYLGIEMPMVFDADHNIINHIPKDTLQRTQKETLLCELASKATLLLSSARSMLDWFNEQGFHQTQMMMNGVFSERIHLNSPKPVNSSYTITYCGTLSKWIDMDWMDRLVKEHPQWQFQFIGDTYQTDILERLNTFNNVKLFGFLPPNEVDMIIRHSDVCIGLYKKEAHLDVNSMKLYDYLAQGVPVVVNNYHPFLESDFNGLLNIANNYEEFVNFIESPKQVNAKDIKLFLDKSTWEQRVAGILNQIL